MPLKVVRALDIDTKEQEEMVQKVVNIRLNTLPPVSPIFRKDVPDIQSPLEEAHWQEIIDQRTAKLKPMLEDEPTEEPVVEPLEPDAPDFDPSKVDLAPKEVKETSLSRRIKEMEKPVAGQPVTLKGGVSSKLTKK